MDLQQFVVLAIVSVAAAYLGRNVWMAVKRWRAADESGCAAGCGKCAYAADPPDRTTVKN